VFYAFYAFCCGRSREMMSHLPEPIRPAWGVRANALGIGQIRILVQMPDWDDGANASLGKAATTPRFPTATKPCREVVHFPPQLT
jgi:hypothetical protein